METGLTADLADEVAAVAAITVDDDSADHVLERVVRLVTTHIDGCSAAALTVESGPGGAHTYASSDPRVNEIHQVQFDTGSGPAVETLSYGEARHVDDTARHDRWPEFARAAAAGGFATCLVLPVRTDRSRGGALALYAGEPGTFNGHPHDIALMLAAQTGVALHNVRVYGDARRAVDNLHAALANRAAIERAKTIIALDHGTTLDDAFALLSRQSQRERRKLSEVAADVASGRLPDA